MNSLAAFQDRFQRAVVDGDDTVLAEIVDTSRENRTVLLGVYRNAYVLRLIDFLAKDYEKLHTVLGDDQFDEMARRYIAAHPSHTPNARWYGAKLPQYLRTDAAYRDTPLLGDLAGLECALNDMFDAPDAPALSMEDIAAVDAQDWPNLAFAPHPATRRLDHTTNAADLWRAINRDETPPEPGTLDQPRLLVACRPDGMATFRLMAPDEAMMWDEAAEGVRFSVLCEMLAVQGGEDEAPVRAAGYLRGWIEAGMLTGLKAA